MAKRIVISDIHGNARTFRELILKNSIRVGDIVYLLGDFIDRGPDSKGVFDAIFQLINNGITVNCVKGNHEDLLLESVYNEDTNRHWAIHCGGAETINSFRVDSVQEIPEKYFNFIQQMPNYLRVDDYIMVHAGLDFNNSTSPLYNRKQMLWIRNWHNDIDYEWLEDEIIIHGHSPTSKVEIETMAQHLNKKQYINIDNGCFKHNSDEFGSLCAFNLDTHEVVFSKKCRLFIDESFFTTYFVFFDSN